MNGFVVKCVKDIERLWSVGFVLLASLSLVSFNLIFGRAVSPARGTFGSWMEVYDSFWNLVHVFFLFCIVMGASGIGEEISQRTIRLWLLRPYSRAHFLLVSEGVGLASVIVLFCVPVAFLVATRIRVGAMPKEFTSPLPLVMNSLLVGLALFSASRFATLKTQSPKTAITTVIACVILLEVLGESLPKRLAAFVPRIEPLVEPGLILVNRSWSYPTFQTILVCVGLTTFLLSGLKIFRQLDIRL